MNIESLLLKNKPLKNFHAGKRCFIVGSGPSINQQDLSFLASEVSIVASSFHRHPLAERIKPQYWAMADPDIWKYPDKFFWPNVHHVQQLGIPTKLFVPSGGADYFCKQGLGPLIDLHFFHYDHSLDFNHVIDFSSGVPPYGQNVVMVCIMLAISLGCNPIYLLGCDHDFYNYTRDEYENGVIVAHAHAKPVVRSPSSIISWDQWKHSLARMDWEYEQLRFYAQKWGFNIFNATRGGYLNNFPRIEYEALFAPSCLTESIIKEPFLPETLLGLGKSVVHLLNSGETNAAMMLLNEVIKNNLNRHDHVAGLDYLKAVCLARMGRYGEAIVLARQDFHCNPGNRKKSEKLMRELELMGV